MRYLLDTNVFREIGKTRLHKNVSAWLSGVDDVDLAICATTVREIVKGIEKLRKRKPEVARDLEKAILVAFDALAERILPIDRTAA